MKPEKKDAKGTLPTDDNDAGALSLPEGQPVQTPAIPSLEPEALEVEAIHAKENMEVRDAISLVREKLAEFRELCRPENRSKLTERGAGKGEPMEMTDKTLHSLVLDYARALRYLAISQFRLDQSQYIHVDDLKLRMPQMVQAAFRFILDEKDRAAFMSDMKRIWGNVKARRANEEV